MRQRNDTGYTQHVSAWPTEERPDQQPFDVAPGEVKDFPELLAGFSLVEESAEKTAEKTKKAAPAVPAKTEEGETP